jgi:alpha-D-xyloside xylohydrolase
MKKPAIAVLLLFGLLFIQPAACQSIEAVAPGIWKMVFGKPEPFLPAQFKEAPDTAGLRRLPMVTASPITTNDIHYSTTHGDAEAALAVDSTENFYGFGLQTNSFEQRGMRRDIRINSWVAGNTGFGHAVMPFFISSKGYGILVNTARYTTFYVASTGKLNNLVSQIAGTHDSERVALNTAALYGKQQRASQEINILVHGTEGMEIYIIAGPSMRQVLQRYNLFAGGGALPPLWSLGFKYRVKASFNEQQVYDMAHYFRSHNIPCDMLGLEPGWQTHAYSCSFVWNNKNFPDPEAFIQHINSQGFKLNLWEHAYTHPTSPLFDSLVPYSGNYTVWSGAVPDFITPQAQRLFGHYHDTLLVKKGVAAFKLDESDGANFLEANREWSFPDIARFPSGVDGVQMRQLFGWLYNKTMLNLYRQRNQRTLFDVRSSYLFASPYPAVLYSDMYDHGDYVRMIVNSGFAGVSWSPEVRETSGEADLIRRLQTSVLSAEMVVNGWYLDLPPWLQYNVEQNNKHQLLPNAPQLEDKARKLINLRMQLLPYLYAAYAAYYTEGIPPIRPLVMDYPNDKQVIKTADEYMLGESILCAPFIDSASTRTVYFPKGAWYDFNTNKKYEGGRSYTITLSLDEIPMFIKDNTILPLAQPVSCITPQTVLTVTCYIYGQPEQPVTLFEDNTNNYDYTKGVYNRVQLSWNGKKGAVTRTGTYKGKLYNIQQWQVVTK